MSSLPSKSQVILAPKSYTPLGKAIFLAGSIQSVTPNWQTRVTTALSHLPITILNPLRPDWDSTWNEDVSDKRFYEQVHWEMDKREEADIVAVYFDPKTKAPITLLELGLSASSGNLIVVCPEGYWKRGNVQVICERYKIELLETVDELIKALLKRLK